MSNNTQDIQLIEEFLKGDRSAFDKIVVKYKDMVFNVCIKMVRNYDDALDVSQNVFISLYRHVKDFRGESLLSTYLYRICMNMSKNRLRAKARLRRREPYSLDTPLETENGPVVRQIDSHAPNPRQELAEKERQDMVRDAVDELKPEQKEVLVLKEFERLKYTEIAAVLSIDIGTVKSRLNRAREELKRRLKRIV